MADRVLVTGGSGFLGINLLRYLHARGYVLRSLDIAPFDYADMTAHVEAILGDIRDPAAVERATREVQLVVHCAAALPLYSPTDIRTTDVDGTRNVMRIAFDSGARRVVHISSTAVYGVPDHHPLLETDRLIGVGPYGEAKIDAEKVGEQFRKQGKVVPILRPKSFVGPERLGVFALLYDWAQNGKHFPLLGNGKNRYQLLDVEDLCQAIFACLTLPEDQANETFNVGAKRFATMREDYQAVLDHAGHHRRIIGFPAGPAIWTLRFLELLKLSPLYKWVYETAAQDSFVSIEKAEEKLGYQPKYSNQQALIRNYDWYVAHQGTFAESSGITHRVPWKQGALRLLRAFF